MPSLLKPIVHGSVRVLALAWLLAIAPFELAATLARLLARLSEPGVLSLALTGSRVLVVALGLMLGRQLLHRHPGTRRLALAWALADLGTLAVVLATGAVPSNRVPGDALWIWSLYAAAAALVVAAATPAPTSPGGVADP